MNLLCPNCQKMLTVPEHFAGQLMKCPLCSGTFTVPALPASVPPAPEPPAAPAPTPAAAVPAEPAPTAPPSPPEVYGLHPESTSPATPAWSPTLASEPPPAPPPAAPLPAMPDHPEPPLVPAPAPAAPPAPDTGTAPSTALPEGYHHTRTIWFSPKVLPWVAPVCVVLIFILQFFTWVCVCPGGEEMISANAWGATFAGGTSNPDLKNTPVVGKVLTESPNSVPGVSALAIVYLLPFVLLVLPVTLASVVLDRLPIKLPPAVQKVLPWRWGIVAALNLVVFFFLVLQLILGFQMEKNYKDWVDKTYAVSEGAQTPERLVGQATRGMAYEALEDGSALKFAVVLHVIAIGASALMFWLDRRGPHRPLPRLELLW